MKIAASLGILAYVTGVWTAEVLQLIVSILSTSPALNRLIEWVLAPASILGLTPDLWIPTTGLLFTAYFVAFNQILWRTHLLQQSPFVSVPDLSGEWSVAVLQTVSEGEEPESHGEAVYGPDMENQNVIEEVIGEATISQSWRRIQVTMDFPNSTSTSLSASFITDTTPVRFQYFYRNEPKPTAPDAAQMHYGTTELRYNPDKAVLEGEYFTDRFRKTSGQIVFRRSGSKADG